MSILELLSHSTARTPDAVAVEDRARRLTYRELDARTTALARQVVARGIGAEALVGICTRPSIETVVAMVGVLKAGAAFVLLDLTYPASRLEAMLADSGVRLVLVDPTCYGAHVLRGVEQLVLRDGADDQAWKAPRIDPAHLAYVVFTSGSTGRPKGVAVTHAGIANLVERQIEAFQIDGTSRVLQFAPLGFDAVISETFTALGAGATLCLEDRSAGADIAELLARRVISVVTLPPSLLRVLPGDGLAALRTVVSAGEACSAEIVDRWARGRVMINAYGPSECTVCATMKVMAGPGDAPTIGHAMAGVEAYVLDDALAPVAPGGTGELYLGSVALARGYLGPTALTAERFVPDPFAGGGARMYRTGDVVRVTERGELEYCGRSDEQVKVRGFRVEPREIESALREHAGIDDVVVVARQRASGDTALVAYVLSPGPRVTLDEVRDFARVRLPQYLRPAEIMIVPRFPLSPNGKVDRAALAGLRRMRSATTAPAATNVEARLEAIVRGLLDQSSVDLDRSFFDQGGDSISAVRLVIALASTFGCKLAMGTVFECPTLRALAARIEHGVAAPGRPAGRAVVRLHGGGTRAPFWLPAPVHGNALCYLRFAQLVGRDVRSYGLQTPGLDGEHEPIADFVALAAHQVQTIREHQPHGPYVLGGWSMGGSLAFEIATQLEHAGETVSHLVLIGATPPDEEHLSAARDTMKDYETWRMAYFYLRSLAFSLAVPLDVDMDEFSRLDEQQAIARFVAQLRTLGPLGADVDADLARRWLGIVRANLYGFHHHVPTGVFHGRTLLVRTGGANPLVKDKLLRARTVSYGTWDHLLAGAVEDRELSANHYTVMLDPWVAELAALVGGWIRTAG